MTEEELRQLIAGVTAKRPRAVLDHILAHGHITTEELKDRYGYNHPPRAARDVREEGIPLETFRVTGSDGRSIAAYRLGDPAAASTAKSGGRRAFPKALKQALVDAQGERCAICGAALPARALQVDHRVPYEVKGDDDVPSTADLMLLCSSCNRAKSWSCESCANWLGDKDLAICRTCYWGNPEAYSHVGTISIDRLTLVWQGDEHDVFERLRIAAVKGGVPLDAYVKAILAKLG